MAAYRNPNIVTNGLVFYMDPANPKTYPRTGTLVSDLMSTTQSGSLINTPTFSTDNAGIFGFDGTNEYLSFNGNLGVSGFDKTISIWAKFEVSTDRCHYGDVVNSTGNYLGFSFDLNNTPGTLSCGYNDGLGRGSTNRRSYQTTGTVFPKFDAWYNVVFISKTNITTVPGLYINGTEITTLAYNSGTASTVNWNSKIYINVINLALTPIYFKSKVGTIQVYNRILTQAEITQNYNALRSRYQ
jgi:hypothetical protein